VIFSLAKEGVSLVDYLEANNTILGMIDVESLHQGHAWEIQKVVSEVVEFGWLALRVFQIARCADIFLPLVLIL